MRCVSIGSLIAAAWLMAGAVLGQMPRMSSVPATGPVVGTQPPAEPETVDGQTFVGFIDHALPRTMLRGRFDLGERNVRPTRSEYFFPLGGLPGAPGPALPERRVDFQELATYFEYAWSPFLSTFIETPYRLVNPEFNDNARGVGDTNFGLKLMVWHDANFLATLQLRTYLPTASNPATGTDHATVEPGLLINWKFFENFMLEGEARYWVPIGGTSFAGDVLRSGLGLSMGNRGEGAWFAPVVEVVGWSVLSGQQMVVTAPGSFYVEDARGQTIVNAHAGVRLGIGEHFDFFAGYGRALTDHFWSRELIRFELRWLF
jgi:hypothetical protein